MLLLSLLDRQDMYGYELIRELERQSQEVFCLKEGTLYPLLHTLEQQGAVSSDLRTADNGRERRYYHITSSGRKLLQEQLKEWDTYQNAVNQVIGGVLFG